jgi:predicted alpha/beta-fold hydrolase
MDAFRVKKPMVKSSLARLIQMDEQFYKIEGMEGRAVSGSPKFKKTGLHLGATLLKNYGFKEGEEFRISVTEAGKIVLEKI